MPSTNSLRPRTTKGQAVTNVRLKTNWSNWSTETSTASSPLDTSVHNTPNRSDSSSLSSLEENNEHIPFPELEVPELDFQRPLLEFKTIQRLKKKEPLTSISAVPDYDLAKFFALAKPKAIMPVETLQIFNGDGRASENPADFLKSFNRAMRQQTITQSNDKIEAFGDYLGTSSQAERWFKALASTDKATWAAFVTAFEKRWPPVIIAEKTKAEYEKELLEHVLASGEVGKKTTHYDRECWTHVAWAAKALQLATDAGIEQSTSMIWQVRSKLPDVVKDLLKDEEYKKWEEFTKAVTELKGSRLVEKQEQHVKQAQELRALRADVARMQTRAPVQNPITALQNQLNKMSLSSTMTPPTPAANSTYSRAPVIHGNQSQQPMYSRQATTAQQPLVITEDTKTAIRQLIQALPQQPDNAAGQAAYAAQLAQWNAKWGENTRVTHETGYPLKPGTAAIASSECFACGTHGHNGRNCPMPADHAERLSRKEAAWRAIVSKVLGAYNRATATPISLVMNSEYEEAQAWIEEITEQQGKADGSA